MRTPPPDIEQIHFLLSSLQIRPALQALNGLTEYRFTAIYRLTSSGAANVVIYDRLSDTPETLLAVPEGESYCGIVRDTRDAFLVTRSHEDGRVFDHPARATVQSYCGVPMIGEDGAVFGSLCHFDFVPHDAPDNLIEMMQGIARFLDPSSGLDDLAETIARRMDRLAMMANAIVEASPNPEELRETFDVYAQPIMAQAQALSPGVRLAMETRINAIFQSMVEWSAGREPAQHLA